jgi:hypothetical protein
MILLDFVIRKYESKKHLASFYIFGWMLQLRIELVISLKKLPTKKKKKIANLKKNCQFEKKLSFDKTLIQKKP